MSAEEKLENNTTGDFTGQEQQGEVSECQELEGTSEDQEFESDDESMEDFTVEDTLSQEESNSLDEKDNSNDASEKSKKSFFKKKKDKKDEKIEELNDRLMRTMAEFDNFRKRTEKEKTQMFEIGAKSIIEKLLPVLDNFERGFDGLSEDVKSSGFAQGMEMVHKQMITSLEEVGVKSIEALNQEFDPNYHNAVMHEESDEFEENIVSQELQKGYMYRDSVVRHSMVKVAN